MQSSEGLNRKKKLPPLINREFYQQTTLDLSCNSCLGTLQILDLQNLHKYVCQLLKISLGR